jgi:hypothetical protein
LIWAPLGYLAFMLSILIQAAGMVPEDCALTGLCGLLEPKPPVAPGVMYAAVGLILLGAYGMMRHRRDRSSAIGDPSRDPPAER